MNDPIKTWKRSLAMGAIVMAFGACLPSANQAKDPRCDVDTGRLAFQQCRDCHSLGEESGILRQGPSLKGVIGRQVGALSSFGYSPAMQSANFVWTREKLARFIGNPAEVIPWNGMPFLGVQSTAERDAIVCFLEQSH